MPKSKTKNVEAETQRVAREFMEENEPLIEKGGVSTCERIVVNGSPLGIALANDLREATEILARNQLLLADAINDGNTPPKRLHILEVEEARLRRALEPKRQAHERFTAFWERAKDAYDERLSAGRAAEELWEHRNDPDEWEEEAEEIEVKPRRSSVTSPKKRGFFSRLFG